MPVIHLKNNKGSSPIIFVILIGLLVIIGITGGIYYLASFSTNQRTIRQVNAYAQKRNEINKIISETPQAEDNLETLEQINKNLKKVKEKWEEIINMELPEKIKNEYKTCHNEFKNNIVTYSESIELRIKIKRNGNYSDSDLEKLKSLESNIDFNESKEICEKAENKMWEILQEQGISKNQN